MGIVSFTKRNNRLSSNGNKSCNTYLMSIYLNYAA